MCVRLGPSTGLSRRVPAHLLVELRQDRSDLYQDSMQQPVPRRTPRAPAKRATFSRSRATSALAPAVRPLAHISHFGPSPSLVLPGAAAPRRRFTRPREPPRAAQTSRPWQAAAGRSPPYAATGPRSAPAILTACGSGRSKRASATNRAPATATPAPTLNARTAPLVEAEVTVTPWATAALA